MDIIFTPEQVANRWNCCANTVINTINSGELFAFLVGKRRYGIPASSLQEYESRGVATRRKRQTARQSNGARTAPNNRGGANDG
ncbi:helix-turn-helix domain-containing protein [Leisingera aquaemixtae]|uniref:helix-turn-helix domain-containing protein n=1 Tax=Leisingera aquaemixtae TaxID=1396826 RepID=UPI0035CCCBCC